MPDRNKSQSGGGVRAFIRRLRTQGIMLWLAVTVCVLGLAVAGPQGSGRVVFPEGILVRIPGPSGTSVGDAPDIRLLLKGAEFGEDSPPEGEERKFHLKLFGNLLRDADASGEPFRCNVTGDLGDAEEIFRSVLALAGRSAPEGGPGARGRRTPGLDLRPGESAEEGADESRSHIYLGISMYPILLEESRILNRTGGAPTEGEAAGGSKRSRPRKIYRLEDVSGRRRRRGDTSAVCAAVLEHFSKLTRAED